MKTQSAVLTVFIGLLAVVSCQEYGDYYCGRRLASALSLLCENGLIKRSEPLHHQPAEHQLPWVPVHHARSMGRSKRQVVSECCENPCTIDELQAYCLD